MRRALGAVTRSFLSREVLPSFASKPKPSSPQNLLPTICSSYSIGRFFSSDTDSTDQNPKPSDESSLPLSEVKETNLDVEDVDNKELKSRLEKYFKGDEEALPSILEAILQRRLTKKHEDTDEELLEKLRFSPLPDVQEEEFESDFEEALETDEEINELCSARDVVMKRMLEDQYFNVDEKKWADVVREFADRGYVRDMRECEEILEDMLHWDNLLPDDAKQKVSAKLDELGNKLENQELEVEAAYKQYQEFEDQIVKDYVKMEEEEPLQSDKPVEPDKIKRSDDPPGVGPVLRWQTRVVILPGGNQWHPKNRKVKLSVTVKELGLSKYQFRRLREIVGKRYHPGKDELTITSERFEHREENRKDCLRTLLNIIEEAGKANDMVEDARTSYVKQRLQANPAFMARLQAKIKQPTSSLSS